MIFKIFLLIQFCYGVNIVTGTGLEFRRDIYYELVEIMMYSVF
jgi:hypothetical protein